MKPKFKRREKVEWDGVYPTADGEECDYPRITVINKVVYDENDKFIGYDLISGFYVHESHLSKISLFDRLIDLLSDPPFKFLIIAAVVITIVALMIRGM